MEKNAGKERLIAGVGEARAPKAKEEQPRSSCHRRISGGAVRAEYQIQRTDTEARESGLDSPGRSSRIAESTQTATRTSTRDWVRGSKEVSCPGASSSPPLPASRLRLLFRPHAAQPNAQIQGQRAAVTPPGPLRCCNLSETTGTPPPEPGVCTVRLHRPRPCAAAQAAIAGRRWVAARCPSRFLGVVSCPSRLRTGRPVHPGRIFGIQTCWAA